MVLKSQNYVPKTLTPVTWFWAELGTQASKTFSLVQYEATYEFSQIFDDGFQWHKHLKNVPSFQLEVL